MGHLAPSTDGPRRYVKMLGDGLDGRRPALGEQLGGRAGQPLPVDVDVGWLLATLTPCCSGVTVAVGADRYIGRPATPAAADHRVSPPSGSTVVSRTRALMADDGPAAPGVYGR